MSGERDVFVERVGLPRQDVGALIDEALVLDKPGEPTAGMILRIGPVDRTVAIRNGMRGVADVGI